MQDDVTELVLPWAIFDFLTTWHAFKYKNLDKVLHCLSYEELWTSENKELEFCF